MSGNEKKQLEIDGESEIQRRRVSELESEAAALKDELRRSWEECARLRLGRFETISFFENAPVGVIIQAADGLEATEAFADATINLVFMDILAA